MPISNCVTWSFPTPGLRTIHLLRSILFRALPSHASPATTLHALFTSPLFTFKPPKCQVSHQAQTTLSCLSRAFHHRSGNSHWISSGFRVLLADAVEFTCCHVDDETTLNKTVCIPLSAAPHSLSYTAWRTFISIIGSEYTFNLWLYLYLFTQPAYELHSGILYATYAALCLSGVFNRNNLRVYPRVVLC